jgi:hypothetical protein
MKQKLFLPLIVAIAIAGGLFLAACGSSSGGDLIVEGTLLEGSTGATALGLKGTETTMPVEGATVSGLGDSDITDANGNFRLSGDRNNVPAKTVFSVQFSGSDSADTVVGDTSGTPPLEITLTKNPDGSYTFSATSSETTNPASGSNDPVMEESPATATATPEPVAPESTSTPEETETPAQPTATSEPEPSGFAFPGSFTAGPGNCGFTGDLVIQNASSDLVTVTFSGNSPTQGTSTPNSFVVSGLNVLGAPEHTCNGTSEGRTALGVSCTNPQGGFCSQTFGN